MNRGRFPARERLGASPLSAIEALATQRRYAPGRYYTWPGSNSSNINITVNAMHMMPLPMSFEPWYMEQLGIEVITAATAGTTLQLGLYVDDDFGYPIEFMGAFGAMLIDSVGFKMSMVMEEIAPGLGVHAAVLTSATSGVFRSVLTSNPGPLQGSPTPLSQPVDGLAMPVPVAQQFPAQIDRRALSLSSQPWRPVWKVAA